MRQYEVGIDLTLSKHITVEANGLKEAEKKAKKQASFDCGDRDERGLSGYHLVGIDLTLEEEK